MTRKNNDRIQHKSDRNIIQIDFDTRMRTIANMLIDVFMSENDNKMPEKIENNKYENA